MAKDPRFNFYPGDFLVGVADMTMEERGLYITLLCLQHQKGRLSGKAVAIAAASAAQDATTTVLEKFQQDEKGLYYNERLEAEREKSAQHSEKQRLRAKKGWEKRKNKEAGGETTANAAALPLENENENILIHSPTVDVVTTTGKGGAGGKTKLANRGSMQPKPAITFADCAQYLATQHTKHETWCRNFRLMPNALQHYMHEFLKHLDNTTKTEEWTDVKEVVNYFANWLKLELQKQQTHGNHDHAIANLGY